VNGASQMALLAKESAQWVAEWFGRGCSAVRLPLPTLPRVVNGLEHSS